MVSIILFYFWEIYGLNYFFFSIFQLSIIKKRERKVEKINKWDYESGIYKFQIGWAVYDKEEL